MALTEQKLLPNVGADDDLFGCATASDGDWLAVSALEEWWVGWGTGRVELFRRQPDGSYVYHSTLTPYDGASGDYFGYSLALDGDTLVVGANYHVSPLGNGKVYVFKYDSGTDTWSMEAEIEPPAAPSSNHFGTSCAISEDTLFIGDPWVSTNAGRVWQYDRTGVLWSYTTDFAGSDTAASHLFGYSMSADGSSLIVGARRGGAGNSGAAYVFTIGAWPEQQKLAGLGVTLDEFGISVGISGDRAVVGAWYWFAASHRGKAFVFDRTLLGVWSLSATLSASDEADYNAFGRAVAIHGSEVLIGAHLDDALFSDGGSAYVYTATGSWADETKLTPTDIAADFWFGNGVTIPAEGNYVIGAICGGGSAESGFAYSYSTPTVPAGGHPLYNRSFEDAGADRGEADWWTEDLSATAEDTAMFLGADGYTYPWDGFEENWGSYPFNHSSVYSFELADFVSALFEDLSNPVESFEFSWREPSTSLPLTYNHQSAFAFGEDAFIAAGFDAFSEDVEDFEEDWGVSPYNQESIYDFSLASFTRGLFDSGANDEEDFENDWGISPYNQSSETVFGVANFTVASFDPLGPENVEDFEEGWIETLP